MKKYLIFTLLLSLLCVGYNSHAQHKGKKRHHAQAQGNKGKHLSPEEKAKKVSDRLEKRLTLNADQKTNVYDLTLAHMTKVKALRATEDQGKREAFKAARKEYNNGLTALFNPTQQQEWEKLKAEAQARRTDTNQKRGSQSDPTEKPTLDSEVE